MSDVYLLDSGQHIVGRLDPSFEALVTKRVYAGISSATLAIGRRTRYASQIEAGAFLYLPDGNEVYQIEQVTSVQEGSARNDVMEVNGRSVEGFPLSERRVIPPPGSAYDAFSGPAESAIKHYVDGHGGPSATAPRRTPNLIIAPDLGRGIDVDYAGRYQPISKVVAEIAAISGLGWSVTFDPVTRQFVFDVIEGADLTGSVFFDFDFQTLERWTEVITMIDSKTVAIVAGQGEGEEREIVTRWAGSEPAGFDRRETFIDARDVKPGQTSLLEQRGDAAIVEVGNGERRLEATIHQYGSFRYREDWDVGDVVLARNAARGLAFPTRVIDVQQTWNESQVAPVTTASLNRALPTIQEKVAMQPPSTVDYASGGGGVSAITLVVDALGRLLTTAGGTAFVSA